MSAEFDLIEKYFSPPVHHTRLSGGDDAALVTVGTGMELVVSTDMLVEGTHFFPNADPRRLGHKALAVNLSDLAAMGARPRWVTLSLAMAWVDEAWVAAFADGFLTLAREHDVDLIGGDTTRGPLNVCVQILGEVATGRALRRDGARVGDEIWVSGSLGDAALALRIIKTHARVAGGDWTFLSDRLDCPAARVTLGAMLGGVATAAVDVSDGLLADLGHVCRRSCVGAVVEIDRLPRSVAFARHAEPSVAAEMQLAGGDDYELCFCGPVAVHDRILEFAFDAGVPLTAIGRIVAGQGVRVVGPTGTEIYISRKGFDHFE